MRTWTWAIAVACWGSALAAGGWAGEAKEAAPKPAEPAAAQEQGPPAGAVAPKADAPNDAKIQELLKTRQLSFDFVDTPLADALSFIKATLGVNVTAAPDLDTTQRITLQVNNMNAGAAIQWMLRAVGAQMVVKNGAIQVRAAPKGAAPGAPQPAGAADDAEARRIAETLRTKKVSFDFVDTPFQDTVQFLQALVNVNIIVAPEVKKEQTLSLRVVDMPVGQALQWMAKLTGARMEVKEGAVFISPERPEAKAKPEGPEAGRDARAHRLVGKAQVHLGPNASIEFYLYEDDIPRELREAVLGALQRALAAELHKAAKAEEAPGNK